ncbi:hypothetical protein ABBQ38_004202 [Trebouxia sp. C0009 RCD-2024]
MADAAEQAFLAFIEGNHAVPQSDRQQASPVHLPLGTAAPSNTHAHMSSSLPVPAAPTESAPASLSNIAAQTVSSLAATSASQSKPASESETSSATASGSEASPATVTGSAPFPATCIGTGTGLLTGDAREEGNSSSSTRAVQPWAPPPVELSVKHVGFLGSLAHALVQLHEPTGGLALLRAAASGVSLLGERLYEEGLDVFMEGLVLAERQRLGDRVLSTFHDHVAHTILQLRQQRVIHHFNLTNGDRMEISWRHAEEHAKTAIMLGRRCKPPEAALEASPLTTMGDIASAMCRFPVAKERYMEAYDRLAGNDNHMDALSASNAAEAATTLAAVADMMLKMGEIQEATRCLTTSLDLLKQHPGQLPALQVKRTHLYLTTLQMQIHIYQGDLAGAQRQLDACVGLTHTGAEYRPGFIRYDEAVIAAAHGNAELALKQFEEAAVVAQQQQDRQLETMAVTAVGLLQTSPGQSVEQQEKGWKVLQQGMSLAVGVGDRLCEAHAAEGMLKALASDGFGKRFKNKRELKRSLQERVQVISQDIGQEAIDASRKMLSFAGL